MAPKMGPHQTTKKAPPVRVGHNRGRSQPKGKHLPSPVNILWTSGWDSTYRVADLVLQQGRQVQPWYVLDSGRRSTRVENITRDRMRAVMVKKDPAVAHLLLPDRTRRIEDIPADPQITREYRALNRASHLGSQYDWLARLAKSEDVTLELSIHKDDKAHGFLEGHTVSTTDGYKLSKAAPATLDLFRWFTFPVFGLSKLDMQEQARVHSFSDVMEMTWFCFSPLLDGKPCGYCPPCTYTREEGLGRRVPPRTNLRRAQYLVLANTWKVRRKLRTL